MGVSGVFLLVSSLVGALVGASVHVLEGHVGEAY